MHFYLRPATDIDYRYCYNLIKRNMYDLFCRHWGGWNPEVFRKGFITKNVNVIMINRKRAGFISILVNGPDAYIDNIQISPKYQGFGIGTELLKKVISDFTSTSLTTFEDNPAIRLYNRLGFLITSRNGMVVKMRYEKCD